MTRDEMLLELKLSRKVFDDKVAALPPERLSDPVPGYTHSITQVLQHVMAYEQMIVERLVSADHGAMTSLMRDREGWEAFNERSWGTDKDPEQTLRDSKASFEALYNQISDLSSDELNKAIGKTAALDPAWLQGREPWRAIAEDSFAHYPQHFAILDAAFSNLAAQATEA